MHVNVFLLGAHNRVGGVLGDIMVTSPGGRRAKNLCENPSTLDEIYCGASLRLQRGRQCLFCTFTKLFEASSKFQFLVCGYSLWCAHVLKLLLLRARF